MLSTLVSKMNKTVFGCEKLAVAVLLGLAVLTVIEKSPFADAQIPVDCCLSYARIMIPVKSIIGYIRQHSNELCRIDAIIFHTKKGRSLCADPKQGWVQKHINTFLRKELKLNKQHL
ncbi:C-C motif chemokine 20-like [Callorhinchus milii]|uniref:C-C motif chemokine n=1 Tax=Callorhinchus milii TaxID=7868 RepID=K4FU51_CALMI|nr:C-C motif chemokine 20-like [Callorhinchus milii]AFK10939.1 C-C motif chemokine 20 isoform 1 [Callorhinchus milii]